MKLRATLAALLTVILAACSGSSPGPAPASPSPLLPSPEASPPPAAVDCGNPVASLRPAGLPAAGQMPAGSYMRTIQDRGRLIAGVSQDTLLFGSLNPFNGQIEGFDIDMLRQVAQAIFGDSNKLELRTITDAQRIPKLRDGSVDIVARTMTINCARKTQIEFSSVYFSAGQRVLVRTDSPVTGIQDLGGKKVCATEGSTSIANIGSAPSKPIPYPLDDWTDCLVAFQNSEIEAISTDDSILAGLAAQDPYAKVVGEPFSDEPYGLGISLDHPEFTRFVNAVLERVRNDGTWKSLYTRWLLRLGPVPNPPPAAYRD